MSKVKMGVDDKVVVKNLEPNSNVSKEKKKIEKITTNPVKTKKKGLTTKVKDSFFAGNVDGVQDYLIGDVILPAIKNTISEVVSNGIDLLMFGETKNKKNKSTTYTSYQNYYGGVAGSPRRQRPLTNRAKQHSFDDIILETRTEAEEVLGSLVELTRSYGLASVADLYDLVGITSQYTDAKWGWFELGTASIRRVREGYILQFPPVDLLD